MIQTSVVTVLHCSVVFDSATPWTVACQASLSFTVSQSLLKFVFIELVMLSNYLILCCPCLLLLSVFPSIMVFSSMLALRIRWSKYWGFSFTSVLPVNIQGWFPLGLIGWISLQSKRLSRVFSSTAVQKHQILSAYQSQYYFYFRFLITGKQIRFTNFYYQIFTWYMHSWNIGLGNTELMYKEG